VEEGHRKSLMPEIVYTKGDATQPIGQGSKVIAHVCNDEGKWGAGFVLAISKRWPEPEIRYRQAFQRSPRPALGDVDFVEVAPGLFVANMVGQHGIRRGKNSTPPIRYDALRVALAAVAQFAQEHNASVHMPRIGCGLAGCKWAEVAPIIHDTIMQKGVPVVVYDFA
jgi:O-acetyl-ADP-ribose deacetylase (regulator of RNase III)